MSRRKKGNPINGWINLYKPHGMTSTQAIGAIRRHLKPQKIGHAGTLDPLATGILPLALGEATKTIPYCQDRIKTYKFTVTWGESRTTDDAEGEVLETSDARPTKVQIEQALPQFLGDIQQTPPIFSAIKVDGQRAYDLARDGQTPELKERTVYIENFELLECDENTATFRTICGKGTYVRSLARDLAKTLGTVGYVSALEREAVGPFTLSNTIFLEIFENLSQDAPLDEILSPVETVLDDIPALALTEAEAARLKNGQSLSFIARPDQDRLTQSGLRGEQEMTALAFYRKKPVALVSVEGIKIQPVRVLNL